MKTLWPAMFAAVLLLCVIPAYAQRAQHGTHGGGGNRGAAPAKSDASDLSSFNRALATQADEQQVAALTSLMKLSGTAATQLRDLRQLPARSSASEVSAKAASLRERITNSRSETEAFLKNLSKRQKAELKDLIKPINKSQSEIAKDWKSYERTFAAGGPSSAEKPQADRLQADLEKLSENQKRLATEMNVPVPAS